MPNIRKIKRIKYSCITISHKTSNQDFKSSSSGIIIHDRSTCMRVGRWSGAHHMVNHVDPTMRANGAGRLTQGVTFGAGINHQAYYIFRSMAYASAAAHLCNTRSQHASKGGCVAFQVIAIRRFKRAMKRSTSFMQCLVRFIRLVIPNRQSKGLVATSHLPLLRYAPSSAPTPLPSSDTSLPWVKKQH